MSRIAHHSEVAIDKIHEAARRYLQLGWSMIPIQPRGKRPVVKWLEYQRRLPTLHELDVWFDSKPDRNVAIVTGKLSGIVVLDIDPSHDGAISLRQWERDNSPLPSTIEVRTGGGGRHLYFKHPGIKTPNRAAIAPGIDLRGDGGCVVAPPSLHASGKQYEWLHGRSPDEAKLAAMPEWLLAIVGEDI